MKQKGKLSPASVMGNDLASVRADALRHLESLVTNLGGDPATLLQAAQIERRLIEQGKNVIPYSRMAGLLDRASASLTCGDFGLRLAETQAAHGVGKVLGPLHVAMRNSSTLDAALQYFASHIHAYSSATRICFDKFPGDSRAFMVCEFSSTGMVPQRQTVEHALALLQHSVAGLTGGKVRAREIWFTHAPTAPIATYRTHFNAIVRFGQSM